MRKTIIAPSVLGADFSNMAGAVQAVDRSGAGWVHLDVMDGRFVPPLTFGAKMVADLRPRSSALFDVHLMVCEPERHIADFSQSGADYITFHAEAAVHSHRIITAVHDLGKKAGVAIVPATPASALEPLLPFADLVLVMTVNPGYGGQRLITECFEKVKTLAAYRNARRLPFLISVDGGINQDTAAAAREAGADILVTGAAFFSAPDTEALIRSLRGD
ncbi:MAG: ribulose-phosphate 3-epimerase [Treponema sp.]|jgi:ribulose-phosphate 3-epimerase|nr:ribulose-phosphate 3-epimerase [Treponema sp.]